MSRRLLSYTDLPDDIQALGRELPRKNVDVVLAVLSNEFSSNMAAYQSVYGNVTNDSAMVSCSRLLSDVKVRPFYEAVRDLYFTESTMSRAEAMDRLSTIARTSLSDIINFSTLQVGVDEQGKPVFQSTWQFKDSADIDPEQMQAIAELTATRDGFKIKMHDPKAAIKQLADMAGWNAPTKVQAEVSHEPLVTAGDILYRKPEHKLEVVDGILARKSQDA